MVARAEITNRIAKARKGRPEGDGYRMADEPRRPDGAQTLERGLRVLRMLGEAPHGLTAGDVAAALGVHRSIAYRLLVSLVRQGFAARDERDGQGRPGSDRYRLGVQFFTLAELARPSLLDVAQPVLARLAAELNATACLVVAENDAAVAVAVVVPPSSGPQFAYRLGSRDPLDRGAAGIALLAGGPAHPGEPSRVATARTAGFVVTYAEIVPGAYGIAAPVRTVRDEQRAAVNVITNRPETADQAVPAVVAAAARISESVSGGAR